MGVDVDINVVEVAADEEDDDDDDEEVQERRKRKWRKCQLFVALVSCRTRFAVAPLRCSPPRFRRYDTGPPHQIPLLRCNTVRVLEEDMSGGQGSEGREVGRQDCAKVQQERRLDADGGEGRAEHDGQDDENG